MGEIDVDTEPQNTVQLDNKFYFVDEERLKESLGDGDRPSFSVASLFSSKAVSAQDDFPIEQTKNEPKRPATIFGKQSLFMDSSDPRIADVGKFFHSKMAPVSHEEMQARRREIHSMVYRKSKRIERNQAKQSKGGQNKYFRYKNTKHRNSDSSSKFKKRKT